MKARMDYDKVWRNMVEEGKLPRIFTETLNDESPERKATNDIAITALNDSFHLVLPTPTQVNWN